LLREIVNFSPLPRTFYEPSANVVGPELLGHFLLRRIGDRICGGVIVETEAYLRDDPACHAYRRKTPRNKAMWGAPGHAYVYLIYGYHFCFNAVCHETGVAEAVLVRAIEPTFGIETLQANRRVLRTRDLTNGPAKLCAAMQINRELDGVDICDSHSSLFIAQNPDRSTLLEEREPLVTTTRIGISKAADWPLRFYLDGSTYVSKK
jgi:DNA-3-methyladenine glycosylase